MNWWLALAILIAALCVIAVGFIIAESWYDVKDNDWDKDS